VPIPQYASGWETRMDLPPGLSYIAPTDFQSCALNRAFATALGTMCVAEETGRFITLATSGAAKDPVSNFSCACRGSA
jgi:hypothetical protein